MFEIRVICEPDDTDRVSRALAAAFATGPARTYPTRDRKRARLYVTAEHLAEPWPTPEQAYTLAPSIVSEIGWSARTARAVTYAPQGATQDREYWLRKAALLDRIALDDEVVGIQSDSVELALKAARFLIRLDGTKAPEDPRRYVRREYARYTHTESE